MPQGLLRKSNVLYQVAKSSDHDQPGKSPPALDHDLIACAKGEKPAADGDGNRIQDHEDIGERGAFDTLFIFAGSLPVTDDRLGLIDGFGNLELDDLVGA